MAVNDIVMGAAGAGAPATYIEDVFSTWLYTGNGSTQTITNGIDLSGKGGLVWTKQRSGSAYSHNLIDTARGRDKVLYSNSTLAEQTSPTTADDLTSFNSNGFSIGANYNCAINLNNETYASWTFREQPKFFDVVTYTGTGANRTIAHSLGSAPGAIIVKRTDTTSNWQVYHNGLTSAAYSIQLNLTNAQASATTVWNSTAPTSSVFSLGTDATVNASGGTYVAYLFAHDAGGFGASGTDNVISCGSFTTNGSGNATINLGYEPQWVMIKQITTAGDYWLISDVMRGMSLTNSQYLAPNTSDAEGSYAYIEPTSTGFNIKGQSASKNFIYIAIRRPMKTPTIGTEVFSPVARIGTGSATTITGSNLVDLVISKCRGIAFKPGLVDRLRGKSSTLWSSNNQSEDTGTLGVTGFDYMNGISVGADTTHGFINYSGQSYITYLFKRAAGFFDVVCYTGTGSARTLNHNLGVTPEMIIVKRRNAAEDWPVYHVALGPTAGPALDQSNASWWGGASNFNNTSPTSTVFTVNTDTSTNASTSTYVSYLFATVAGISKVGSYTGTGATLNINAGFTTGARFVMIKRTDSTGDWFYWDTARGMVSGTDPRLALNLTAAESNADWVYTASSGFQIVTTDASVNASGGSYIYLAIA